LTQREVAMLAGLSKHQEQAAVSVANVPAHEADHRNNTTVWAPIPFEDMARLNAAREAA
jgi:hypothetical protein